MSERALVSVIVPAYNAERWIATALRSVFAQTWRPLEVVVVDDGSSDATAGVVEDAFARFAAASDVATHLIRHETNRGAPAARNTGTRHARGELLRFLDADDWLTSDSVERHAAAMAADPAVELACGTVQSIFLTDAGSTYVAGALAPVGEASADPLEEVLRRPGVAAYPLRFTFRRPLFERVGGFNETLQRAQEYDLVARMLLHEPKLWRQAELCGYYRHHDGERISTRGDAVTATVMIGVADNLVQQLESRGMLTAPRRAAAARLIYLAAVRPALLAKRYDIAETAMAVARVTEPQMAPPTKFERFALRMPGRLGTRLIRTALRYKRWRNMRRIHKGPRLPLATICPEPASRTPSSAL